MKLGAGLLGGALDAWKANDRPPSKITDINDFP